MSIIETMPSKPSKPAAKKSPRKRAKTPREKAPMAATADRHICYEASVQCVEAEIDFVDDTFRDLRGRRASVIREDFCGTANSSCEWVRRRRTNRAYGVDLDQPTLDWGLENHIAKLPASARSRVTLLKENVLETNPEPVDAVLAMNFSYYTFQRRADLRRYFQNVRESLSDGGIFFLDCYGGYESFKECKEKREINKDFTYVWEQAHYEPITGRMICYIHFHFSDGSKMNRAFSYEWRMWTVPEIREVLEEAGFARSTIYWEGTDEDTNEGNGVFEPESAGEADPAWVAYIVAEK
ncbi:MAG: class I SAM-dependent methyltransferase [Planctomycetota bacterium]